MKSGLWQPGKLQVVTWRGTAKCSAAWKEALDEKTVAIDDIDDDGNTLLHMAAGRDKSCWSRSCSAAAPTPRW